MSATDDPLRGRIAFDGTSTPLKTALFVLVCAAWLVPGLIGHDPWKYDEAVVFGIVNEILRSGDWINLKLAGEPYFDKAPLFIWVATALAKALGGVMPLQDAARLAAGVFMAVTLVLLSATSIELVAERGIRLSVLLFIGCLGLLIRAHEMTTDLAGLTGVALGLYGLALAARSPRAGGLALGAGMGLGFLGNGFLPAGMLLALMAVLPACGAFWRTRSYLETVAIAIAVALPLAAIWPVLLGSQTPGHLGLWLDNAAASRWSDPFTHDGLELAYFLRILPWYAWPAWPLAAWALWRGRASLLDRRALLLPLAAFLTFFVVASIFGEARDANGMAMLFALSILGVAELESLPRGAASALDWFGMTTFFLFAAIIWMGWIAALTGRPEAAAAWLAREVPGYHYRFDFIACALAALLTLIWLVVVARSLRSTRRALVNWAAGITMVWVLMMTLGMPIVDQARSYRGVVARLAAEVGPNAGCIARQNVGDAQRALLDYFGGLRTVREETAASSACRLLLVQAAPSRAPQVAPGWHEVWRGSRPGDRNELFILYAKNGATYDFQKR